MSTAIVDDSVPLHRATRVRQQFTAGHLSFAARYSALNQLYHETEEGRERERVKEQSRNIENTEKKPGLNFIS